MTAKTEIEHVLARPAITVAEVLRVLPVSRNGIYEAIRAGEIDSFRIGKKILIRTASLRRQLGIEAADAEVRS